jgi:hypothetical protein
VRQNYIIAALMIVGVIMLITGFCANKSSSFDDGSFIVQVLLMVAGGAAIIVALLWKFVLSFF